MQIKNQFFVNRSLETKKRGELNIWLNHVAITIIRTRLILPYKSVNESNVASTAVQNVYD